MSIKKIKGLLTMALEQLIALFEKNQSSGSKSTVLNQVTLMLFITIIGFIGLVKIGTEVIYLYFFGGIIICFMLLFIYSYLFCLHKNPNLLRSEKHIEKTLALKKGLLGDNLTGLLTSKKEKNLNAIIPGNQSVEEDNSK